MKQLQFEDGKMINAAKYGQSGDAEAIDFSEEELKIVQSIKVHFLAYIL